MKFKVKKRYSLAQLGEGWEECYLDFSPFTMREINEDFTSFASLDKDDPKSVTVASNKMTELLKNKYVGGTGLDATGKVVDIKRDDLLDLPAEVISGVISFLSSNLTSQKKKLSTK